MSTAVVDATAELRAEGHDVETIASLFLNGAAALLIDRSTEEEFGELARRLWRTTARQLDLLALLDRVEKKNGLGVRPKRKRRPPSPEKRTRLSEAAEGAES